MIATLPGGLALAWAEAGSGTALLLVHGWPHDGTLWRGQLGGLATHARCLVPDLRGFGGTPSEGPHTIDQYADDLAAFLEQLAVPRATICGLSMGGYVAMAMYRRHRARVGALILASTRASADSAEQRAGRERLIAFAERNDGAALAEQQLDKMVGATTRQTRREPCDALRGMIAGAPTGAVTGAQRAMMAREDSTAMLASVEVPVLVIAGAEDAIIPGAEQRAMAEGIGPEERRTA